MKILLAELKNNKRYYFFLAIIIAITSKLNWNANLMDGILPYYFDFANYFSNNFEFKKPFTGNIYTWPMWGYGFIIYLFKQKIYIIIFQQSLTFVTIICFRIFARKYILDKSVFNIFSLFLLFSIQVFCFQTSVWPYSLAANILIISIILIVRGVALQNYYYIFYASILWGTLLNLRSDYFYLTFFVPLSFLFIREVTFKLKTKLIFIFVWLFFNCLLITPWCLYSYQYTGHYIPTSTNGGHVLFLGLGQLPQNKWKITPSDNDFKMYEVLRKNGIYESSLTYKSDIVLRREFARLIKQDPFEYFKKVLYNFGTFLLNPFYNGSIHEYFLTKEECAQINLKIKSLFSNHSLSGALKLVIETKGIYYYFITITIAIFNFSLIIIFFKKSFIFFTKKRNLICEKYLITFIYAFIIYQITFSSLTYILPLYNTNIYLLYLFVIFYISSKISLENKEKQFKLNVIK